MTDWYKILYDHARKSDIISLESTGKALQRAEFVGAIYTREEIAEEIQEFLDTLKVLEHHYIGEELWRVEKLLKKFKDPLELPESSVASSVNTDESTVLLGHFNREAAEGPMPEKVGFLKRIVLKLQRRV